MTIRLHFADKCDGAFFARLALYAIFIRFVVEYRSRTFILFLFARTGVGIPCQAGSCIGGLGANRTVFVAGPPGRRAAWHATVLNGQEMWRILSRRKLKN